MKLSEMLKKYEYESNIENIGNGTDLELIERVVTDQDLIVWAAIDKDADETVFLRDDNAGWTVIYPYNTREDQLTLAAWNVDFDIRKLSKHLTDEALELALEDAKDNHRDWGFEKIDGIFVNKWDQ